MDCGPRIRNCERPDGNGRRERAARRPAHPNRLGCGQGPMRPGSQCDDCRGCHQDANNCEDRRTVRSQQPRDTRQQPAFTGRWQKPFRTAPGLTCLRWFPRLSIVVARGAFRAGASIDALRALVGSRRRRAEQCRRRSERRLLSDCALKAKALPRQGLDQSLIPTIVADRGAHRIDACIQGRVGNDTTLPNRSKQIVLADHAVAVADQIHQQVEHLRLDSNRLIRSPQLAAIDIDDNVIK